MVTEVLGLLIIVGALLVLVVRYMTRRQQRPVEEQQEMQQSTIRLKEELERSGDAIIERLGSHVTHLEELIREADAKNALLDAKISESRRLEAEISQRADELNLLLEQARANQRQLSAQAGPMRLDARDFASVLQNSIERDPAYPAAPPQAVLPQTIQLPVSYGGMAVPQPAFVPQAPLQEEAALAAHSAQQAEGLAEAMTQHRQPVQEPVLPEESAALAPEPESAPEREPDAPQPGEPNPGTAAAKARAMLLSGYSVEEVAKDTGLGKRAVELIQQMNKRELEQK